MQYDFLKGISMEFLSLPDLVPTMEYKYGWEMVSWPKIRM